MVEEINSQLAPWPKMTKPRGEHKTGAASASHYSRPPWLNSNILSKARYAIWKIFALRRHDFRYTTISWVKHALRFKNVRASGEAILGTQRYLEHFIQALYTSTLTKHFTQALYPSTLSKHFIKALYTSTLSKHFIQELYPRTLSRYYKGITKVLQGYYKGITKVLQRYYKHLCTTYL